MKKDEIKTERLCMKRFQRFRDKRVVPFDVPRP